MTNTIAGLAAVRALGASSAHGVVRGEGVARGGMDAKGSVVSVGRTTGWREWGLGSSTWGWLRKMKGGVVCWEAKKAGGAIKANLCFGRWRVQPPVASAGRCTYMICRAQGSSLCYVLLLIHPPPDVLESSHHLVRSCARP